MSLCVSSSFYLFELHASLPLPSLSLRFEVKAIAAGALDDADGGAIETQEGLAALRAFEVFLNHVHSLVLSDAPVHCSAIALAIPWNVLLLSSAECFSPIR